MSSITRISDTVVTWKYISDQWIIEVFTPEAAQQIFKWSFAKVGPSFGVNHYRRQFLIPAKKIRLACKLLGHSLPKNPNRVKAGRRASTNHPITRGHR